MSLNVALVKRRREMESEATDGRNCEECPERVLTLTSRLDTCAKQEEIGALSGSRSQDRPKDGAPRSSFQFYFLFQAFNSNRPDFLPSEAPDSAEAVISVLVQAHIFGWSFRNVGGRVMIREARSTSNRLCEECISFVSGTR